MQSDTVSEGTPAGGTPLKRALGLKLMVLFVVGDILGTGVYATLGNVAGKIGGALWVPFVIGFGVAILTAGSYAELVGKYPKAAGAALYTQRAYNIPFLTFIVAFMVMCSGLSSASAAALAFGGDYLHQLVPVPQTLAAVVFVLALAALNLRGVSESVKTNVVLTLVEVSGLLVIIGIGVWAVLGGDGEPARLTDFHAADSGSGFAVLTSVLGATALGFFAFVGFEDSVNMAEETVNPARTFPRALFIGVSITGVVYVLVASITSLLVDSDKLPADEGALLAVVKAGGVGFPPWLFALIGLFAVSNSALINLMMASRLCYGMANERVLPGIMGRVLPSRQTPVAGIVFVTLLALGLVSWGEIEDLGDTTSFLLLCVFALVNITVLVLRRDRVDHRHFRMPTVLPALGAIAAATLASPLADRDPHVYVLSGVLLAIGVALWVVNRLILRASSARAGT